MKRLIVALIPILFTALNAAEEAPATAREAFEKNFAIAKKFVQTHPRELKITGHLAKIVGAYVTLHSYYKFLFDMGEHMERQNKNFIHNYSPEDQKMGVSLFNLWVAEDTLTSPARRKSKISRPPYFTALAIAAYLIGDGCYGIFKEVKALIKERTK